ncbi:flavin-containing monooxygenase [Aminobacter anthyllidis]|nr:NAD(P)/FAD-dependent oxidoreductase [Aminobacter anthyllidis]
MTFVLVIGAGQAGLATGCHLRRSSLDFLIVDSACHVGNSWRKRYESLTLFTPRQFSALPGLPLVGNRELYATREEFADYLQTYATRCGLPVRLNSRVVRLARIGGNAFEATLQNGKRLQATHVVVATGGFQKSVVPPISAKFDAEVVQLNAETYRNIHQIPGGRALVVGDGASGRDIAVELSSRGPTALAAGKPRRLFPERVLGKSVWWWLSKSGVLKAPPNSTMGQFLRRSDAFPDRDRSIGSLTRKNIAIMPRLVDAAGDKAIFSDGSSIPVAAVIWAVGYVDDSSWLGVPEATAADGSFLHTEGVSPVHGLFFVGKPWQRNRTSALIMGVGDDARLIVQRIAAEGSGQTARG